MTMQTNAPRRRGTTVAVALSGVVVLALLVPRAAGAVNQLVSIVDGDGTSRVQVDNGKLRVGDGAGALTVNGAVRVSNPVTQPIPVRGFQTPVFVAKSGDMVGNIGEVDLLTVPAGKLLVVESVSVMLELPAGQSPHAIVLRLHTAQRDSNVYLAPTFLEGQGGLRDTYTFSGDYRLYAPAGSSVQALGVRLESSGLAILDASISGYLTHP
jgi:hypothetical protein